MAIGLEPLNKLEHFWHKLCGTRLVMRGQHTKRVGVFVGGLNHSLGKRANRFAVFNRSTNNLVVDIGDVANIGDPIPKSLKPATHHVKDNQHTRMANMAKVIHSKATDIQANMPRLNRNKRLLGAR